MTKIKLTQNKYSIVDDEDFNYLNQYKWHYGGRGYAVRRSKRVNGKQSMILMHREILHLDKNNEFQVDHINKDKLDNRKQNLRLSTINQNNQNRKKPASNSSGYKGVFWRKDRNRWISRIKVNNKLIHLGSFSSKVEASIAYKQAVIKYHGEFACLD